VGNLDAFDSGIVEQVDQAVAAIRRDPKGPEGWLDLAIAYDVNGVSLAKAAESYGRAITLAPEDPKPRYYLALLHARTGEIEPAIANMRAAAERAVDYAPARWRLGLLYLDAGDLDAAEAAFDEATALDPGDAAGWIGLGRVALQRGRPAEAIERLARAAGLPSPNQPYAHQLLATAYQRAGRAGEAEAARTRGAGAEARWTDPLEAALAGRRSSFGARSASAQQLLVDGRAAEAVALLEALRRERPEDFVVLGNLGLGYIRLDRQADAAGALATAVAINPEYVQARTAYASALANLASESDREAAAERFAEAQLDRAAELRPADAEIQALRAEVRRRFEVWQSGATASPATP